MDRGQESRKGHPDGDRLLCLGGQRRRGSRCSHYHDELPDRTGWLPDGWEAGTGRQPAGLIAHIARPQYSTYISRTMVGAQGSGKARGKTRGQGGREGRSAGTPLVAKIENLICLASQDRSRSKACDMISRLGLGRGREISWSLISMRPLDWAGFSVTGSRSGGLGSS